MGLAKSCANNAGGGDEIMQGAVNKTQKERCAWRSLEPTWTLTAFLLMAGGAQLEAAHLQHLAAALARRVQADAFKGALCLHRPLRRRRVIVPTATIAT